MLTKIRGGEKDTVLKEILTNEMVQFTAEVTDWEEAIRLAAAPLLANKCIDETYVTKMIANVKEFGPYIILMPQIAMPHARPEDGVNVMGISLLVTEKSVAFDAKKEANVFIVLAAKDANSHLALLMEISIVLSNPENVDALVSAKSYSEIVDIL